ncbi:MAG: hypothetical protein WC307_04690 [Candidatus Nanoarchaeia archaeon]|jgi:hypothetical protein
MGGSVSSALEELRLADHMLYVTFPLLDDKRVFLNAVNHLGNAIKIVIRDFMRLETDYKRLSFMPSEDLLINEFVSKYATRLGLSTFIEMIKSVTSFNNVRSRSSIKLKKNEKFIVISPEYSMVVLSIGEAKSFVRQAKDFINQMSVI